MQLRNVRRLVRQGVESNPGPTHVDKKFNLKLRTYNCNGLGNHDKMRRLFTKARSEVNKGGIILLRETHIVDETLIKMYWNMNYVTSCVSTQSAGVQTLYDNSFVCLESHIDNSGRMAIAVLEKGNGKLIIVNLYVPCDAIHAIKFMETVYDKLNLVMDDHADAFQIIPPLLQ